MTRLEEEIKEAMIEAQWGLAAPEEVLRDIEAKAAAEVAEKHIQIERERIWAYLRDRSIYAGRENGDVVQMQHIVRATNGLKE